MSTIKRSSVLSCAGPASTWCRVARLGYQASQPPTYACLIACVFRTEQLGERALLGCYLEVVHVEHKGNQPQQRPRGGQEYRPCAQNPRKAHVHGVACNSKHARTDQRGCPL